MDFRQEWEFTHILIVLLDGSRHQVLFQSLQGSQSWIKWEYIGLGWIVSETIVCEIDSIPLNLMRIKLYRLQQFLLSLQE